MPHYSLELSSEITSHYKRCGGEITVDLIASSIADKLAGFHISYSAKELLKDLKLLTKNDNVNKNGRRVLARIIHYRYHDKSESYEIKLPKINKLGE